MIFTRLISILTTKLFSKAGYTAKLQHVLWNLTFVALLHQTKYRKKAIFFFEQPMSNFRCETATVLEISRNFWIAPSFDRNIVSQMLVKLRRLKKVVCLISLRLSYRTRCDFSGLELYCFEWLYYFFKVTFHWPFGCTATSFPGPFPYFECAHSR